MADEDKRQLVDNRWEEVQKKAFGHWVNSYLEKRALKLNVLEDDFADGITVIHFVEVLCGKKLRQKYAAKPKLKAHFIENTHLALQFLLENGVEKRMLTIGAEDFVDKNVKLLLGFLWMLFRKFRIQAHIEGAEDKSSEEGLLIWCRQVTEGYKGVNVVNFSDSFNDGLALLAMIHKYDDKLVNYDEMMEENSSIENIEAAFDIAEKSMGIPKLLSANELADGTVDERSVVLYVSLFFHAFVSAQEKHKSDAERAKMTNKVTDLETQLQDALEASAISEKKYDDLAGEHAQLKEQYDESQKRVETLATEKEELEEELREARLRYDKMKEKFEEQQQLQLNALDVLRKNLIEHLNDMNTWKDYLEQDREYESEVVQAKTEKEIIDRNFEDQLEYLSDVLADENKRLEHLLEDRRREEEAAGQFGGAGAATSAASPSPRNKKSKGEKSKKKKAK